MSEAMQMKDLIYLSIIVSLICLLVAVSTLYIHERRGRTLSVLENLRKNVEPLLTQRELEIYLLQKQDLSAKQIADKLNIAKSTVDTHSKNINKKLREAGMMPV